MRAEKGREYFPPIGISPERRKRQEREGKDFQENQTQKNHQRTGSEGKASAKVPEDLIEGGEVGQNRGQGSQETIGQNSSGVKGEVVGDPPGPKGFDGDISSRVLRAEVEGIGHDQRPAHT